jgi:hypothetical protein
MREMKNLNKDECGIFEPLFIIAGVIILILVGLLLWLMDKVWFAIAGVLFFIGALIVLQGTPLRGWLGVGVGAVILLISVVIGLFML